MMNNHEILTLGLLVSLMFSTALIASEEAEKHFERLDANKDGYLDAEEVSSRKSLYERLKKFDADENGMIDKTEFSAYIDWEIMTIFDHIDSDKDGYINAEETSVNELLSEHWSEFDADENGKLDRVEYRAYREWERKSMEEYIEETIDLFF
jgi:Ca2+-binding EF-hand superfamily protein